MRSILKRQYDNLCLYKNKIVQIIDEPKRFDVSERIKEGEKNSERKKREKKIVREKKREKKIVREKRGRKK